MTRWRYERPRPRCDGEDELGARRDVDLRRATPVVTAVERGSGVAAAEPARARAKSRRKLETESSAPAPAPANKKRGSAKPSLHAEAIALAFEAGRGDAMDGVDESDAAAFNRALRETEEGTTCAIGTLQRDVVRVVGGVEIWFAFSSNFRPPDADECKAAKKAAKKFGESFSRVEEGDEAAASTKGVFTELLGFGVIFEATGEFFFLPHQKGSLDLAHRLDALISRCRVVTYHAQEVVQRALDVGISKAEPSTANFVDCRVDAWLMNPDRAYDGGISEVSGCFEDVTKNGDASWDSPTARLRADLALALRYYQRGSEIPRMQGISFARIVEAKIAVALGAMQHRGMCFDRHEANTQRAAANARVEELQNRARDVIGGVEINLSSAQQVGDVLYNQLKLPPPSAHAMKGAKSSHLSTSVDVLQQMKHPFAQIVLDHRGALKERAMCEGYDKATVVNAEGHARIHTRWNNTSTATGRLSSSAPNVQQVGRGSMRNCFIAPPGRVLVAADYGQIELRVLAHLTEDERLISLFNEHSRTVDVFCAIWNAGRNLPIETPTEPGTRDIAKRTAYGIVYGQHATGLAEKLNCSKFEAQGYIAAFHRAFPRVQQWISRVIQTAERDGAVIIPFSGRHRPLPKIHSNVFSERSEAQRQAVNTVIQGSASDLIKTAMLRWCEATKAGEARAELVELVAQIHDELLFECEKDYVQEAVRVIRSCMEGALCLSVPTPVKISTGKSWGELVEIAIS